MNSNSLNRFVPLILRLALASVFIVHGWGKLSGDMGQLVEGFGKMGIPAAPVTTWLVAVIEFFGGLLVLLGLFTRYAAAFIALVMVGAMVFVKFAKGFVGGWEFDLVLFAMALSLVIVGDGPLAVGNFFRKE